MPRIEPFPINVLAPEHEALIEKLNQLLGSECNDRLSMARVPLVVTAALELCNCVLENATGLAEHLRGLVCHACSRAYGCQYCVAMMGLFNRWNDTMSTGLERPPCDVGERVLSATGIAARQAWP